jgi:hypothetical protein
MLYAYPRFVRQSGIGNRLFPWARAYLFAKDHGAKLIWPNWEHFRVGALFKGGVGLRNFPGKIYLLGNFTPDRTYVSGLRKQIILRTSQKLAEVDTLKAKYDSNSSQIVIFDGVRNLFTDLAGSQAALRNALISIARPAVMSSVQLTLPPIALNIRRGKDFRDPEDPGEFVISGGLRTPLKWFCMTLQRIRRLVGSDIGAYVVSDGDEGDLDSVLSLPNTVHIKTTTALADLLLISQARLLIASGGSAFSAWGAFLSGAPTLCVPGQSFTWFGLGADHVGVFDPVQSSDRELRRYCSLC